MKPICYVAHDINSVNGWGRVSREIASAARDLAIPHYLLNRNSNRFAKGLLTPVRDFRFKPLCAVIDAQLNKKILTSCSAIHCLTEPMIPFALTANNKFGLPLFLNLYGTYGIKLLHGKLAKTYREAYEKAEKIFVSSDYSASRVLQEIPVIEDKLQLITLGSSFKKQVSPRPFGQRDSAALFVGEIKKRKGVLEFIKAGSRAIKNGKLTEIIIVGKPIDRDYYDFLLQTVEKLVIKDNVKFLGPISDDRLSELYSRCLVSVLASIPEGDKFEGFGLVHSESFAHGTPSIGCYGSGSESAIRHDKDGLLVEPGNITQLSSAIERIVSEESLWESFSKEAHGRYRSWKQVVEDYSDYYSSSSSDSSLSSGGTFIPA